MKKSAKVNILKIHPVDNGRIAITFSFMDKKRRPLLGNIVSHYYFDEEQLNVWVPMMVKFLNIATTEDVMQLIDRHEAMGNELAAGGGFWGAKQSNVSSHTA